MTTREPSDQLLLNSEKVPVTATALRRLVSDGAHLSDRV
jgi:hypothetical protein